MTFRWRHILLLVLIGATLCPGGAPASVQAVEARLADDGRTVVISAPGIEYFRGGFAATIAVEPGTNQVLSSISGARVGDISSDVEETPYGPASVQRATFHFDKERVDLLVRVDKMLDSPVVMLQAGVRNTGSRPLKLVEAVPLAMDEASSKDIPLRSLLVSGKPDQWLLTGLHLWTPVVTALDEIRMPLSIYEEGGLYRHDGVGFLFGPVGVPVAYVRGRVTALGVGRIGLTLAADMSGVVVAPGMTRWGQQIALFMEPPREALVRWTEWVAKTHGARTGKGALSGWSSWYFKGKNIAGKDVLATLDQAVNSEGRLRPGVVQIDNGYQVKPGITLETNDRFPEGLAFYAKRIAEAGIRCRLQMPMQLPTWHLSADTRHNLLLAYKEALHNALKHSRATEVTVGLTLTAAGLMLFVEDNGSGLAGDAGLTRERQGNGLANMRNRLAHLKGTCRILPREGGGTRVEFEVPGEAGRGL